MTHRHFGLSNMTAHHLTPGQVRSGARHHAPPVEARCNSNSEDRISFWFWSAFIISTFATPFICVAIIRWFQ